MFIFGEVGVACSEFREGDEVCWGEVMTMTLGCDLDKILYVEMCVSLFGSRSAVCNEFRQFPVN